VVFEENRFKLEIINDEKTNGNDGNNENISHKQQR
jgi:hypothetical protein